MVATDTIVCRVGIAHQNLYIKIKQAKKSVLGVGQPTTNN